MQTRLPLALCATALAACTTAAESPEIPGCSTMDCVGIGQSQEVFTEFSVTPLAVREDSRCPIEADCIWEGRVLLDAQLDLGHESITVALDSSERLRINGGFLSFGEIAPDPSTQWPELQSEDYRFGFLFAPDTMGENSPHSDGE